MARNDVKVNFLGDADSLARAAAKARAELSAVDRRAHTISTGLGTAVGTIAGRAIGGVASAAANGVRSLAGLASASINAASSLNETLSKNEQVFGSNAKAVEAWARDSKKNILLTVQAGVEGAATFGNLFVALGVSQASAAKMSTTLVGLASDLSSFNDVGTDEALAALQSGLLGEAEPMRRFGVSLSEARVEAEAYALGLAKPVKNAAAITAANNAVAAAAQNVVKVEKEHGKGTLAGAQARDKLARAEAALAKATAGGKAALTDAQKVQARQSIILKDTAKAQGDAARTSDGYANSLRILKKDLGDASAVLGTKLLPYAKTAVQKMSELVTEFQNGTGTGGEIRDTLGAVADVARDLGGVLDSTVVPAVKFFADHPDALKAIAESMVIYAAATKTAAVYSALIKPPPLAPGVPGVPGAPGGGKGGGKLLPLVGGPVGVGVGVGLVAGVVDPHLGPLSSKNYGGGNSKLGNANDIARGPNGKPLRHPDGTFVLKSELNTPYKRSDPRTPDDYDQKAGRGNTSVAKAQSASTAAAAKAAGDELHATQVRMRDRALKDAKAQKYATDQFAANEAKHSAAVEAAAERKRKAAEALQAATEKIRDALQARKDMARGIRDDLVSSNSVLREGLSYTAKDLLTRFRAKLDKVKQFSAAISAMVHKGYAPSIVQQVAAAGVGGLATARALATAPAAQVSQFNAVQTGINNAAQYAGDRATKGILGLTPQLPPQIIQLVVDGKVLATTVNTWNAQASGGRPGVRGR